MTQRRLHFIVSSAIVATGALALAPSASVGEPNAVSRKILEAVEIPDTGEELRLMRVEFSPGASSPAHTHPAAGVCYVVKGTARTQYADEAIKLIKEGESFQDQADRTHAIFGNPSSTDPLIFVCAARVKKGQPYFSPIDQGPTKDN
jgi:quercetin dioxygenase-like cupin family protein